MDSTFSKPRWKGSDICVAATQGSGKTPESLFQDLILCVWSVLWTPNMPMSGSWAVLSYVCIGPKHVDYLCHISVSKHLGVRVQSCPTAYCFLGTSPLQTPVKQKLEAQTNSERSQYLPLTVKQQIVGQRFKPWVVWFWGTAFLYHIYPLPYKTLWLCNEMGVPMGNPPGVLLAKHSDHIQQFNTVKTSKKQVLKDCVI